MTDYSNQLPDEGRAPRDARERGAAPTLVFSAVTEEEAEVVRATLEAAGIPAFLQSASVNPMLGAIDGVVDSAWVNGVFVPSERFQEAREVLDAPPLTEEELGAAEEADPTTLEQAEERARKAR